MWSFKCLPMQLPNASFIPSPFSLCIKFMEFSTNPCKYWYFWVMYYFASQPLGKLLYAYGLIIIFLFFLFICPCYYLKKKLKILKTYVKKIYIFYKFYNNVQAQCIQWMVTGIKFTAKLITFTSSADVGWKHLEIVGN